MIRRRKRSPSQAQLTGIMLVASLASIGDALATNLAECAGTAVEIISARLAAAPSSTMDAASPPGGDGAYVPPSESEFVATRSGVVSLIEGEEQLASAQLAAAGLITCRTALSASIPDEVTVVYDANATSRVLSRGRSVLVLRDVVPPSSWIASIPHAVTETNVVALALELLAEPASSTAGIVVGAVHRCNSHEPAGVEYQASTEHCDGMYRRSDMAHNDDTDFHAMHAGVLDARPASGIVQLHGMATHGASVSRGESLTWVDYPLHRVSRLHEALIGRLGLLGESSVDITACSTHDGPHGSTARVLLCGSKSAATALGHKRGGPERVVHLELGPLSRSSATNRSQVVEAWIEVESFLHKDGFDKP